MNSLDKMEEEKMLQEAAEIVYRNKDANKRLDWSLPENLGATSGARANFRDGYVFGYKNAKSQYSKVLEDYDRLAKLCEKQAEEIDQLQQQIAMLAELFCVQNITAAAQKYFKEHDTKVRFAYRKELLPKMVDRFLSWKLPKDFSPDAGITFTPEYNKEYMASLGKPPSRHEPMGTNLLNAAQAEDMCAVLLGGMSDEQVNEMVTALRVSFFKGDRK